MARKHFDSFAVLEAKHQRDLAINSMIAQACTRQGMLGATALALNRDFGFGEKRLSALNLAIGEIYGGRIVPGFGNAGDADVFRELVDRDLKAIAPTLWVPWEERYEYWADEEAERFRRRAMKNGKIKHKR